MTAFERSLEAAREGLLGRARREGLARVAYDTVDSPLGPLWVAVGPRGLCAIHYGAAADPGELAGIVRTYGPALLPDEGGVAPVARQLGEYFRGRRRSFDLEVDTSWLTPFQRRVLGATARVPFGSLTTYAEVAARAGSGRASRAAGQALGSNPIPIVIPCHRVVASDGSLGGYSGGLDNKRRLLALEGAAALPGGWEPSRRV